MDDALRGGTLYHLYCAKLIQGWGGDLGESTANSEIGREFLAELDAVSIKHVRLLIKKLVEKSYDKMDPISLTDEDILVAQGACYDQISTVHQLRLECSDLIGEVQKCDGLRHVCDVRHAAKRFGMFKCIKQASIAQLVRA